MDKTTARQTRERIAQLRAQAASEPRDSARAELLLTAMTLEARLGR